ncbi:mitotic interactor and substrate of PLK1 [Callithrix jacchus]|uniref:mitotic interactor and substrate of PLK1 n=1 Tax=Callithrix jacchus TaxID=9483 RepID=UPI00159DC2F7|nr:mitotic interactor and substrate of PLK1 [Callithrix jacchus]XP_008985113.2 mitotic interactor and substrate of PLK1 [Callithrix jacchus]XP_008985115.2 mitotic interactor and substrate of PLK1 [Callithrix jacchus]XP_017823485.2 mitotic interactor and substrate of PLK1 [Callithrix jacchus]XP_035141722.1 mitotic interactor and substrate of PLK1 [Callithrix jacchus]XP_035141723.1 mitotic interactor and substrate of PLK1 [Callithrix jacchus]XP_054106438.1 mitotic interactor and substrate of PL
MDRVTRYPILGIPQAHRATGLVLDGDTSYTYHLVRSGPEASGWDQDEPQAWPTDHKAQPGVARRVFDSKHAHPGWRSPRGLHPENGEDEDLKVYYLGTGEAHQGRPARALHLEDGEDEEVKAFHLGAGDAIPRRPWDLERERWAVIQGQAVRKSGTVATLQGTSAHGDPRIPGPPGSTPLEDNVVDTEQIDFLAARQQFLSLEQVNKEVPHSSPARGAPAGTAREVSQVPRALTKPHLANGHVVPIKPQVKRVVREEKRMQGVPTWASVQVVDDPGSPAPVESPETPRETPIEREIRLAQEREADLREQRGLRPAADHQELVEIPTRPLLTKASPTTVPRRDRGHPSLYVQRDMVQETQREKDHRREGLQLGRASARDRASEDAQPGLRRALSSDSVLSPAPDARAADPAPEVRKVNRIPPDAYQPYLSPGTPRLEFSAFGASGKPSRLSTTEAKASPTPKATMSPRHLSESSGRPLTTKQEHLKSPQGPLRADGGVLRWDYPIIRPLLFRIQDVPQQAQVPPVWGWEVAGAPALRLQRSQSSELLEREMESVLRREREVAEERRNALFPEVFAPTPDESRDQDSRSSSRASGITGSYSVSESPLFTPTHLHSTLAWTAKDPGDNAPPGQRRKEQWYAGIDPSDRVNSEVLEAIRVTRHKNAMAERWESRIHASEEDD